MTQVKVVVGYFNQAPLLQSELREAYSDDYVVTHMTQGEGKIVCILEREGTK